MNGLPKLEEYLKRSEGPELFKTVSPDGQYVKFKYSDYTTYNLRWDPVTLNARGHVFRLADGQCVLRPWNKFFNYGELRKETGEPTKLYGMLKSFPGLEPLESFDGPLTATDKLDGSLCIAGIVDGALMSTTSGAFTAWQGGWANVWLIDHGVHTRMVPGFTYLFEIICDRDLHPIRYDFEGCVLLGIIDNATGEERPYADLQKFAEACGIRVTERVELGSFKEIFDFVRNLPASKEGLVLTYPSGFKVKVKGPEFLKVQKVFHSLSEKSLLDGFSPEKEDFPEDVRLTVPEEFKELRDFMDGYALKFRVTVDLFKQFAGEAVRMGYSGRELYDFARETFKSNGRLVDPAVKFGRKSVKEGRVELGDGVRNNIHEALVKLWKDTKNENDCRD